MLQFNLLPDIKQEHIKSQKLKQTVVTLSGLVAIGALTIMILLFMVVNVLQKKHLKDVNADIKTYSSKLQSTPDLNKILTVQNQLNSLPAMHDKKPVALRLFNYLSQVVPAKISISNLSVDFVQSTIKIDGTADSISTINQFVDTLKFTTYSDSSGDTNKNAFTNVVLTSFSKSDKGSNFTISASFDPAIFDSAKEAKLTVPNKITTRSNLNAPDALFIPQTTTPQGTQ
jgi:hypothetical protein